MQIFLLILLIYLVIMNSIGLIVTTIDKRRAKKGHSHTRIAERTLLIIAALGGAPMMYLTMLAIRHKTQKKKFMVTLPFFILLWIAAVILIALKTLAFI